MSERFSFDDAFLPVPPAAVDANPERSIKEMLYRVSRLENELDEVRAQAVSDQGETMLEIISLSDDLAILAERWGVATKAQDAAIMGGVMAFGRKLIAVLKRHQVEAINTIGQPCDPGTSDVVAREAQEGVPANTVLREVQSGYTWPHGILRRAKVVVSAAMPQVALDAPGAAPQPSEAPSAPDQKSG